MEQNSNANDAPVEGAGGHCTRCAYLGAKTRQGAGKIFEEKAWAASAKKPDKYD
jgi:hypothetical protein